MFDTCSEHTRRYLLKITKSKPPKILKTMKNKYPTKTIDWTKKAAGLLLIVSLAFVNGCTTTATQQQVLSEPMTSDLEAKVLKETGVSGAAIGAVAGAVVGGLAMMGAAAASGASAEQALTMGIIGAVAGGTAGGIGGYQEGKKKGQQVVAQAMTRDQVRQLVQGAREYNARLAKNNATMSAALQRAKASGDKKTLGVIRKEGTKELKVLDQRLATREKALNQGKFPAGSEKSQYLAEVSKAKSERGQLVQIINESSAPIL